MKVDVRNSPGQRKLVDVLVTNDYGISETFERCDFGTKIADVKFIRAWAIEQCKMRDEMKRLQQ